MSSFSFTCNVHIIVSVVRHPLLTGEEGEVTEEDIKDSEERLLAGTPLERLGKLSEVANLVVFLCSDEASYISGATISVDGGRRR